MSKCVRQKIIKLYDSFILFVEGDFEGFDGEFKTFLDAPVPNAYGSWVGISSNILVIALIASINVYLGRHHTKQQIFGTFLVFFGYYIMMT